MPFNLPFFATVGIHVTYKNVRKTLGALCNPQIVEFIKCSDQTYLSWDNSGQSIFDYTQWSIFDRVPYRIPRITNNL